MTTYMQDLTLKSKSFLIPTVVLVGFIMIVLTALSIGERKPYSMARMLIQWDGQHYLSIAREGYQKYPCPDNPALICGNVGWFPVYPLAARAVGTALRPFGLDMRWGMLATSLLSFWLALLLLYRLIARRFDPRTATFSLIALVSFPTSFYFLTAFPYAFYLLLAVLVFYLLDTTRFLAAVIPAALLAATYPSGVVIGLPILWTLIAGRNRLARREKLSLLASTAAVGLGLLAYGLYYWYRFNDFFLYVHFQSKPYYAHEASFPLAPIIRSLLDLPAAHPIFVMLLFVIATLLLFYRRRLPVAWQLYLFAVLLFTPAAGTTTSYYRHIIVAFPLAIIVGDACSHRYRRWAVMVWFPVALILMWAVFLKNYKLGLLM